LGIKQLSVVERFTDQRIAFDIAALDIFWAVGNQINGQAKIELVKDLERLPEGGALKRANHQQIDVGIGSRRAAGM